MSKSSFSSVAAVVFGIVAIAHAARGAMGTPILVGETAIPLWVSWLGLAIAGSLSIWGFRAR
ncbi:MAG TPA: hypothetical protein VFG21_10720 [Xanthomonadaceae bacterium]|nr:hypothetical protein [Xanthomonadaceae bacterium]